MHGRGVLGFCSSQLILAGQAAGATHPSRHGPARCRGAGLSRRRRSDSTPESGRPAARPVPGGRPGRVFERRLQRPGLLVLRRDSESDRASIIVAAAAAQFAQAAAAATGTAVWPETVPRSGAAAPLGAGPGA